MNVRYLILAHKNPAQFARLVEVLNMPGVIFYIHIDQKVSITGFRRALANVGAEVRFVEKRFYVNWGGFSTVLATLALLKQCAKECQSDDRVVLLSGQDYPIKSNEEIAAFFALHADREFVSWWRLPSEAWKTEDGGKDRYQYYWLIDTVHLRWAETLVRWQKRVGIKRGLPGFVSPVGGSQWFLLTAECVQFILDYCKKNKKFLQFWSTTRLSDEMFFNTILLNSEYATKVENTSLKYIDWLKGPEVPRILRLDDFIPIKESRNLFARKVDPVIPDSSQLMDEIDHQILCRWGKTKSILRS
jgi:hypothetical protein